jgi:hypothetical protein
MAKGTNAGRVGTKECPKLAANENPSPVVPHRGKDNPPVVRMTVEDL